MIPTGSGCDATVLDRGFRRVTVLERRPDDGTFGKTHTFFHEETKDVPHEMGTCYLSASYKHVRSLLSEYVGDDATIEPGGGRDGPFGGWSRPSSAPRTRASSRPNRLGMRRNRP